MLRRIAAGFFITLLFLWALPHAGATEDEAPRKASCCKQMVKGIDENFFDGDDKKAMDAAGLVTSIGIVSFLPLGLYAGISGSLTVLFIPGTVTWVGMGMISAAGLVKGRLKRLGMTLTGPIVGGSYLLAKACKKAGEECALCCQDMREACCPATVVPTQNEAAQP